MHVDGYFPWALWVYASVIGLHAALSDEGMCGGRAKRKWERKKGREKREEKREEEKGGKRKGGRETGEADIKTRKGI